MWFFVFITITVRKAIKTLFLDSFYSSFDFQTPVKPIMEGVTPFYNLMFLLTFICFFWMLLKTVKFFAYTNNKNYIPVSRGMFYFNYFKH